ncbi:conserved hypothetical protein [Moraxellaceae bacterium 17A]|nr:conserved hypothetical protein [Moraxellaceae bacterium 17A]
MQTIIKVLVNQIIGHKPISYQQTLILLLLLKNMDNVITAFITHY